MSKWRRERGDQSQGVDSQGVGGNLIVWLGSGGWIKKEGLFPRSKK